MLIKCLSDPFLLRGRWELSCWKIHQDINLLHHYSFALACRFPLCRPRAQGFFFHLSPMCVLILWFTVQYSESKTELQHFNLWVLLIIANCHKGTAGGSCANQQCITELVHAEAMKKIRCHHEKMNYQRGVKELQQQQWQHCCCVSFPLPLRAQPYWANHPHSDIYWY